MKKMVDIPHNKSQEILNSAMSNKIGNIFTDVISGKVSVKDLKKISEQFKPK